MNRQTSLNGRVLCRGPGVSAVLAWGASAMGQASFTPLGFPAGTTSSSARAISGDGTTVVGVAGSNVAWCWRSGTGMTTIPRVVDLTKGLDVSRDGSVVVGTGGFFAGSFRYSPSSGAVTPLPAGPGNSSPEFGAVSPDGATFGGSVFVPSHDHHLGIWNAVSGYSSIPAGIDDQGLVQAFSEDGSVAVGYGFGFASGAGPAFRWSLATGYTSLGFLPSSPPQAHSVAYDVTPDGAIVVGYSDSAAARQAFRWTSGTGMVDLGTVASSTTAATSISDDGSIIVGQAGGAFIWDQTNGVRGLQSLLVSQGATGLTGWTLTTARSISGDGLTIAGSGIDPNGATQAYIARLLGGSCYPNCDHSTTPPVLSANDFQCFLNQFAAGDPYANCDGSTAIPVLNTNDFLCFLASFAEGC